MAKRNKKSVKAPAKVQDYVVVAFAKSEEEAKDYEALLRHDNIPATVKQQIQKDESSANFAVMVPEEFADEAYVIVESHDTYDDFYDMEIDEEEDLEDAFDDNF
jgi:hypothetical protein